MRDLVLFDMDGTLTPARKPISLTVVQAIRKLCKFADVGIVTGSGYEYVIEQCASLWDGISDNINAIQLLPCNGTQRYLWEDNQWRLVASVDMQKKTGKIYQEMIRYLLATQYQLVSHRLADFPITGTFFQYRGSILNWCLIGRDSGDIPRRLFHEIDEQENIRQKIKDDVLAYFHMVGIDNIVLSLGGHTSIDVYPYGWDKTYALKYFPNRKIWFVGDSCTGSGNDRSLYEALTPFQRAYITTGPEETIGIIKEIMTKISS